MRKEQILELVNKKNIVEIENKCGELSEQTKQLLRASPISFGNYPSLSTFLRSVNTDDYQTIQNWINEETNLENVKMLETDVRDSQLKLFND